MSGSQSSRTGNVVGAHPATLSPQHAQGCALHRCKALQNFYGPDDTGSKILIYL